jgi:hypothetical protein
MRIRINRFMKFSIVELEPPSTAQSGIMEDALSPGGVAM